MRLNDSICDKWIPAVNQELQKDGTAIWGSFRVTDKRKLPKVARSMAHVEWSTAEGTKNWEQETKEKIEAIRTYPNQLLYFTCMSLIAFSPTISTLAD